MGKAPTLSRTGTPTGVGRGNGPWTPSPPGIGRITSGATHRLNEAANALAAAAAAAVLEATANGESPNPMMRQSATSTVVNPGNLPRFSSGAATSSEDGESICSRSFYNTGNGPRKPSMQNGSAKVRKPKVVVRM